MSLVKSFTNVILPNVKSVFDYKQGNGRLIVHIIASLLVAILFTFPKVAGESFPYKELSHWYSGISVLVIASLLYPHGVKAWNNDAVVVPYFLHVAVSLVFFVYSMLKWRGVDIGFKDKDKELSQGFSYASVGLLVIMAAFIYKGVKLSA